jgi:hypothetical protein
VESAVQVVQRWIVAALRKRTFGLATDQEIGGLSKVNHGGGLRR